ncbi:MAG: class A beta-lactamase-related serine hydrolase [Chitinophagaceae bacterium]|nr:MAG: class A beta-lactamase-related serine hydrolase [Chitinophagaceae bacterium]
MQNKIIMSFVAVSLGLFCNAQNEKVEAEIQNIMKKLDVVGLTVAVVKKDQIVYSKAFGYKELELKTPLQTNHLFRIASISKSFSATAMMKLVDAGKISLDADFGELVGFPIRNPKYPERVITLKMVLSHTSGINDSEGYFNLDVINPSKNPDWAKCYNDYAPGEGYEYCNLNFNMVGTVLEKISGVRFDNYIRQEILTPLGLNAGYCIDSLDNSLFATLYSYDSTNHFVPSPEAYAPRREQIKNYVMGYSTPVFSPTGGMKISSDDLARYMMMHMYQGKIRSSGSRLISRKRSRLMQSVIAPQEGYGLALWNTKKLVPGKLLIGHTGSAYGLYSAMFFDPKKKFGFVVITNGCNPVETDGTNQVLHNTINTLYNHFIR